jgi:virulence factor
MRIGVVGLGSIAQKAYLPVLCARDDVSLVFCTRDAERRARLSRQYRVRDCVGSIGDLLGVGVEAAFVHTATESHVQVVAALLDAGIHVYVDKPLAYTYRESCDLVERAERAGCALMVGFNRRYAPLYRSLAATPATRFVLMQKNRITAGDHPRRLVYDDFIHVVDTLKFVAPAVVVVSRITTLHDDGQIHHVSIEFRAPGFAAIGIMNRGQGSTDETLEVIGAGTKWVIRGLDSAVHYAGGEERVYRSGDWESVLHRRGFPQIVDAFIDCVASGREPSPSPRAALDTHAVCEQVVTEAEASMASTSPPVGPD